MKQPSIPTNNIVELFDMIVKSKTFPDQPGSETIIKPGEKKYGTIMSSDTRRIWTSSCILAETHNSMVLEHKELHECPSGAPQKHDCEEFNEQVSALLDRINILEALKWQAMHEDYPESFGYNVGLRDGWEFVQLANSDTSDFGKLIAKQDPACQLKTLVSRITDIFRKEPNTDDTGTDHDPVDEGEEVICEIVDNRIKALFRLFEAIAIGGRRLIPHDMPLPKGHGEPMTSEFKKWVRGRTIGSIEELYALTAKYLKCSEVVRDLFWRSVRDTYPATNTPEEIGLRAGWKIVEVKHDHSPVLGYILSGSEVIPVTHDPRLAKMFLAKMLGIE